MPNIRDQEVHKAAAIARKPLVIPIDTAIDLTAAVVYSFVPGFKFQVVASRSFCRTKAGTVTANIKIGARTAAAVVFTAATEVAQTLSTTLANIRGSSTDVLTVELTTDGSGVLTNSVLTITIRPYPLAGDIGPNT